MARRCVVAVGLVGALFGLAGCTVVYYDLNGKLTSTPVTDPHPACLRSFSLVFEGFDYTNTFGAHDVTAHVKQQQHDRYARATQDILASRGCQATAEANAANADLRITIRQQAYVSALPQEWLTGLSFGVIPSWGTRPNQFVYTFETRDGRHSHRYTVDEKSISQLLLTPISLVSFFTASEDRIYKSALSNYLNHPTAIGAGKTQTAGADA